MQRSGVLEERLTRLFAVGSYEADCEFVLLAGPLIYSYLHRVGAPNEQKDDLYQDVFFRIFRARHQFDPTRRLIPWILTITVNVARTAFTRTRSSEVLDEAISVTTDVPSASEALAGKELLEWIDSQLHRLPAMQREAIILCCFENVEQREAAEILSIPESTLRTNLRRARIALAKALQKRAAHQNAEVLV